MGGEVKCTTETCSIDSCPIGQITALLNPTDCCPVCVSAKETCKDNFGVVRLVCMLLNKFTLY